MNIKKILTIVITLVMGIALTGVLATNINNVENGYIEYNGEQYKYFKILEQGSTDFAVYTENDFLIDETASIKIYAENVYISDFNLDVVWNDAGNSAQVFDKNHNTIELLVDHATAGIDLGGNSNGKSIWLDNYENISGGEIILTANVTNIKNNVLTILSLVPLIFAGAVVYFVYNSRFD